MNNRSNVADDQSSAEYRVEFKLQTLGSAKKVDAVADSTGKIQTLRRGSQGASGLSCPMELRAVDSWTTIIGPHKGAFDWKLAELWRCRDLISLLVWRD